MKTQSKKFNIAPWVTRAHQQGQPIIALESTVITHGLPYPENLTLARDMEAEVTGRGGIPATVALLSGKIHIGLTEEQLAYLANAKNVRKISVRDFSTALARGEDGGTTVAGTLIAAQRANIKVFATGGIGGVHREPYLDISADLPQLARTPMIVVCAGVKAILDLPATLEYFETAAIPVIGYQTDEFPAFYSKESGLPVSARADTPAEVAAIANAHWGDMGLVSGILVAAPPPPESAMPAEKVNAAIEQALDEARTQHIRGQAVTPFLLSRVSELTQKESLQTNLALLRNNARVATDIAIALTLPKTQRI